MALFWASSLATTRSVAEDAEKEQAVYNSHRVNKARPLHHTHMHAHNSDVPPQDFCAMLVGIGSRRFRRRGGAVVDKLLNCLQP